MKFKPLSAGNYECRVTFYRKAYEDITRDASTNQTTDEGEIIGRRWASIESALGKEDEYGMQMAQETTHIVKLRYYAEVHKTGCWFVYKGRRFDIMYALNVDEQNRESRLYCVERLPNAV